MNYIINLETTTPAATQKLLELDATLVGTPGYLGIEYFWHYAYRIPMRDITPAKRRRVHLKLLEAGLELAGKSSEHQRIIDRWAGQEWKRKYGRTERPADKQSRSG
mgnify:CR=1 FL=1|jgi:hypothetical protein